MLPSRLSSRKFWLTQQVVYLSIGVPILFHSLGIPESVTVITLGVVGGAGAVYGVVNVMGKKFSAGGEGE